MELTTVIQSQVNIGLIAATIIVLEVMKRALRSKDIPPSVWKYAIFVMGALCTLLTFPFGEKSVQDFFKDMVLYAAGAGIVYQTFKPAIQGVVRAVFASQKRKEERGNG